VKVGIKTVRTVLLKCEVVVLKSIEGGKNISDFFFFSGQLPKNLVSAVKKSNLYR
jgi:hypothetical protein